MLVGTALNLFFIFALPRYGKVVDPFDVAKTATGHDRAALIDKFGGGRQETPQSGRANH